MMRRVQLVATVALGVVLGCSSEHTPTTIPLAYCSAPRSISVEVTVTDSVTGASIADAAHGVVQNASTTDTLQYFPSPPLLAGGSTLGTFSIIIDHAGYAHWRGDSVTVSNLGPCGNVIPVQFAAKMQPLP